MHQDKELRQTPVTLGLYWDDVLLRRGYTNRIREDIKRGYQADKAGFQFPLRESLTNLLPEGTTLRVDTLEEPRSLEFLREPEPVGRAVDGGEALRAKLAAGCHIDHWGALKMPFGESESRRRRYSDGIKRVEEEFRVRYGKVVFPFFGTLLGYAREGRFLAHDDDVDTAYLSRGNTLEEVAAEFWMIAEDLRERGHYAGTVATGQMHVRLRDSTLPGVDVFSAWLTPDGSFYCPPYVGGRQVGLMAFKEIELEGNTFVAPEDHERFLEMAYGPGWRTPDPLYQMVRPPETAEVMTALKLLGPQSR